MKNSEIEFESATLYKVETGEALIKTDIPEDCKKCGGEIFKSKTLSRCLRCGKATDREISGSQYYKDKKGSINNGINNSELR